MMSTSPTNPTSLTNPLFPVFLKLENLRVLLVGGGKIGTEKINALLNNYSKAQVHVVADWVSDEMRAVLTLNPHVHLTQRKFESSDLNDADVVIVAINDRIVSQSIAQLAKSLRLLTNVADTPDLCDFYLGSIVQKGALKIAISTNGLSPTIAKRLREFLTDLIPDSINLSLENLAQIRKQSRWGFEEKVEKLNQITEVLKNQTTQYEGSN